MNINFKKMALVLVAALCTSNSVFAASRIVLRSDYGTGDGLDKVTKPIKDRINGMGHILAGKPLGGSYDLVYQGTSDGSVSQVFRCPSVRECKGDSNCQLNEKYWQCDQLYNGPEDVLCKRYKGGYRVHKMAGWISDELVSGLLIEPFHFMNHGVGLAITNVSEVIDDYKLAKDIIEISCHNDSFSGALEKANQEGLLFLPEKEKESVDFDLGIFYDPKFPTTQAGALLSPNTAQTVYDYMLKPVILNPKSIQNGMIEVQDK